MNRHTAWGRSRARICACITGLLAAASAAGDDRVILISVDGLRADAVTRELMPRLTGLREQGAHARVALCDTPSITLPNHTSMLTGLTAARHGVTVNRHWGGTVRYMTLLDYAHRAGLRTAFFASKEKLQFLAREQTTHYLEILENTTTLVRRLAPLLGADGPDVIFLHLGDPDVSGHDNGWMSRSYQSAVRRVDGLIGQVFDLAQAARTRNTYMVVTADHGGEGTGHYSDNAAVRRIPWIAVGPGIPAGLELAGTVSTTDTMPTALWLMGLDVPAGLSGAPLTGLRPREPQMALRVQGRAPQASGAQTPTAVSNPR